MARGLRLAGPCRDLNVLVRKKAQQQEGRSTLNRRARGDTLRNKCLLFCPEPISYSDAPPHFAGVQGLLGYILVEKPLRSV